jgi:GH24 family phage-related lysozyme (muramidase)
MSFWSKPMSNFISTTVLPDPVTASDELQLMLTREEGSRSTLYIDSNGYPSIGIGANLTVSANLIKVMSLLGVDTTSENVAKFMADLTANPTELDKDVASLSTKGRTKFILQPEDISALFSFTSQNAIDSLNALLAANGTPIDNNTAQFMALASLYFNSKHGTKQDLIGPMLRNALAAGDNAQAWYQIRYNTDKNDPNGGIETRRLYESQVFGLNAGSPSLAQADQAYEMLAEHRKGILQKEKSTVRQVVNNVLRTFTVGVNPDGSEPVSTNLNPPNLIENAIENYGLFGSTGSSPVNQSVQTLAQIFNPDAEEIASTINTWFANIIPNVGILNDSMSGAFEVRSTDVEIAPDSREIANGFATSSPDQIEASDSPAANHILIGPDSVNRHVPQPSISLIGGTGDDLLVAGAGGEVLFCGLGGNDTLIGGQAGFISGNAGNDTLQGGPGTDKFVFYAPSSAGITETILPWANQLGSVEVVSGSAAVVLTGSTVAPFVAADGESITWDASPSTDDSGVTYAYSKISGSLTISGGLLGTGAGANTIIIQNFDLSAAANGGFLGISLPKSVFLNATANKGIDPPSPDFDAGTTQSYTVSTDVPSRIAQTVTLTLSGVNPADFTASVADQAVQQNSDGTFSFALLAGQTSVAFSLTNTADVGSSGSLSPEHSSSSRKY